MELGFFSAMFIVFLALKLGNLIDWSWAWVTAPLWGSAIVFVIIGILFAVSQAGRR